MTHILDTPKPAAEAAIFLPENTDKTVAFAERQNALKVHVDEWKIFYKSRDPEIYRDTIGKETDVLGKMFSAHVGLIIIDSLSGNLGRVQEYLTPTLGCNTYTLPTERVAAAIANTQWYGIGFDVRPVINFRLQVGSDFPEDPSEEAQPGRWHQIDLVTANVKFEDSPRG